MFVFSFKILRWSEITSVEQEQTAVRTNRCLKYYEFAEPVIKIM